MRRSALAAAALAVVLAAAWFWPTDARRIRATLDAVAAALSSPAGEPELQRVVRIAGLAKHLATNIVVEGRSDGPSVRGRDTVMAVASRVATGPLTIELDGVDLEIDGTQATASAFARVRGERPGAAGDYDGAEVRVELTKIDGSWVISRVAPDRTLTR